MRNCGITDVGSELIGIAIGDMKRTSSKLLSLNLSGNFIGDKGAIEIAKVIDYLIG
jgi:hypothetical protein